MSPAIKFLRRQDGATIVEYALVIPIFLYLLFFIVEASLIFFSAITIENSMLEATRLAKIGATETGMSRDDYIRQQIRERSYGLINPDKLVITNQLSSDPNANYFNVPKESCTDTPGGPPNGSFCPCAAGQFWIDDPTGAAGVCDEGAPPLDVGGPGDIIRYTVLYQWNVLVPGLNTLLGGSGSPFSDNEGNYLIVSGGAVRNEPF